MLAFAPDSRLVSRVIVSPNQDQRLNGKRPTTIVLHYIGPASTSVLFTPGSDVSAHYIVETDGSIIQCVPEALRAWHAGRSVWRGEHELNAQSIGIEIVNGGHEAGLPDYPEEQIRAVIALCRDIVARHHIAPDRILAHSDVAPARKQDPGEKFPWRQLHEAGVGIWVPPHPIEPGPRLARGAEGPEVTELQNQLAAFGYGLAATGVYDGDTELVVTAFQRRFRPLQPDGVADLSTLRTLRDVLKARAVIVADRFTQNRETA